MRHAFWLAPLSFLLGCEPPPEDLLGEQASATYQTVDGTMPASGGTVNATSTGASNGYSSFGNCGGDNGSGEERIYAYSPTVTGMVTISTCGSTYDTVLYVRDGSLQGSELGCNDDVNCGCPGGCNPDRSANSLLQVPVIAGHTYYIFADRNGGAVWSTGTSLTLNIGSVVPTPDAGVTTPPPSGGGGSGGASPDAGTGSVDPDSPGNTSGPAQTAGTPHVAVGEAGGCQIAAPSGSPLGLALLLSCLFLLLLRRRPLRPRA